MLKRINLQYFSEVDENLTVEEPENKPEEKTFTQAELEEIITKRLERERKKRDEAVQKERDEAERKKLEEANEYKELYEKSQAQLTEYQAEILTAKKDAMLAKAGYNDEQIAKYRKYLEGSSEDEINASLTQLIADIPPKFNGVDPSAGNTPKQPPKQTDLHEEGQSLYQRLKASGKLRR